MPHKHDSFVYFCEFAGIFWGLKQLNATVSNVLLDLVVRFILIKIYYILMNNLEPHLIYVTSNGVFIKFSMLDQTKATVGYGPIVKYTLSEENLLQVL